jgi:hypothetical protein
MRRTAAVLAALLGLSAIVAVGAPAAAATTDLVINEVESDGDSTDWVELYNPTGEAIDASGLRVTDNDPTRTYTIAGGTVVAAGGFVAIDVSVGTGSFGLGNGDEVHLWDGGTEIDSYVYEEHAVTTWGACPDGSDSFIETVEPTKGAANACELDPADVLVINEIETSGGAPGDWIEIMNTGLVAVDAGGLIIRDSDDAHELVIPSPTVIPAGGFAAFDVEEGSGGFGLNSSDTARLFAEDGVTLIDSHTLPGGDHSPTTIGRCPNGVGDFAVTASSTKAAANDCVLPGNAGDIAINEIESDDPADGPDWVELHNSGASDVDVSGWMIADDGEAEALPAETVVPAGGFLVLEQDIHFTFGLGNGDEVHLYLADGLSVVDEISYEAHAAVTLGRCPDGSGPLAETAAATPGAANACDADPADALVINEIESNGDTTDWVELYNTALVPVDASGLLVKDSGESNTTTVADGTIIPAGGFLAVDTSGLGGDDTARLLTADDVEIDSYAWEAHADETFGRCPDGVGAFADTDAPTKGAANDCPAPAGYEDIVINEVESSGGSPADWVELYNTGETAVDLSLWILHDSEDDHTVVIPGGTSIQPQGFVVIVVDVPGGFGLGNDDRARLYLPDDATLVDERIWGPDHSPTTFGLCPDGTGELVQTFASSKGEPNDCSAVRINEVESSGGAPGDWVELTNAGEETVDVSGFQVRDDDDSHVATLPDGTTIAAGGYLVVDVETEFGFGLGGGDTARLFAADGATLLDSYGWSEHAPTTYARCPDGVGEFAVAAAPSRGEVNDCAGIVPAQPWPGGESVVTVDVEGYFGEDMSGVAYEGTGTAERGTLWAVNNGSGVLFKLEWNGAQWVPAAGEWASGKELSYPDGTGQPDAEGVGFTAAGSAGGVYVATERNDDASGVSRPSVLRYDVSDAGTSLTATHEWNLASLLPAGVGNNTGLEGVAWMPDSLLVAQGLLDESTGEPYDPADYPGHGDGLFFVGVEGTGDVYAVALPETGDASLIASIDPGLTITAEVAFDASTGLLWAVCDEACAGRTVTLEIAQDGPFAGTFQVTAAYENPVGMDDGIANEGFAVAPQELCVDDAKPVFYADDSGRDGHSLREGTLDCVSTETPVEPVAPIEADLTADLQNLVTGPASARPGERIEIAGLVGFAGGEVEGWIFSEPAHLGTLAVSEAGTASAVIPSSTTTGMHRVAVADASGEVIGWFGIQIVPAADAGALASTGGQAAPVVPIAITLLALGGLLIAVRLRRPARP